MRKNKKIFSLSNEDAATFTERTITQEVWQRYKKSRTGMAALVVVLVLLVIAISTYVVDLTTKNEFYDNNVINIDLLNKLQPPSWQHLAGTDEYGRDVLLRIIWGTRLSLFLGVLAVLIALVVGGTLGAISGFYGKKVDSVIMRLMDVLMGVPTIILAIAIVASLGISIVNLILAVGISAIPGQARVIRAAVMSIRDKEFIEAARASGAGDLRLIFKYVLPNCLSPVIVNTTLGVSASILNVTSLSFIGLGVQAPNAEWGSMLSAARAYIRVSAHITLFPGLAIFLAIMAINLMGDALRDALDPRLKGY